MHGIRYLDVRVTHHPFLSEKFWVSHDTVIPQIPLPMLLADIQRFHEETNKEEIVFVDFHRVTIHSTVASREINRSEAEVKIHSELIQLLDKYLGRYAVLCNNTNVAISSTQLASRLTPNMLWNWGRTIFVTYPEPLIRNQYAFLWPPFQHVYL